MGAARVVLMKHILHALLWPFHLLCTVSVAYQMGPSNPFCTDQGYPPMGAWHQSGCVCVPGGARGCKYHTAEKPYFSTIECTDGACDESTCTIVCDQDFIMRGCQGRELCQRSCEPSGYWIPAMTKGPEFQPRCVPGPPAKADVRARAESAEAVVLEWNELTNAADSRPSRQWTILGAIVNSRYHHGHRHRLMNALDERTEEFQCVPQEHTEAQQCRYRYSGLQADTTYSFAVRGSNFAGEGPRSEHVEITTKARLGEL